MIRCKTIPSKNGRKKGSGSKPTQKRKKTELEILSANHAMPMDSKRTDRRKLETKLKPVRNLQEENRQKKGMILAG